jgi:formiminotetrahydrofolate cyclodeaminase
VTVERIPTERDAWVIEIIYRIARAGYNRVVKDFEIWFDHLSSKPLPGAVAAAAVAAAMGAALIAKTARITLRRQELDSTSRDMLQALWDLAKCQQAALIDLADADHRAYRAVLEARSLPASAPARTRAWQQATETPIRISEACRSLLECSSPLLEICWPAVCPDPEIGIWLLETGMRAGLAAAVSNIGFCGDAPEARSLQLRIDAFK